MAVLQPGGRRRSAPLAAPVLALRPSGGYIIFLPSVALIAIMVPTFARTPIVRYSSIVLAAVGTGFLSFCKEWRPGNGIRPRLSWQPIS